MPGLIHVWLRAAAVANVVLLVSHRASAAPLRYGVDETELHWLRTKHPELAAKLQEGEDLLATSPSAAQVERAGALFGEASNAQPRSTLLARRHCQVLTALGKRDEALAACKRASDNNSSSALVLRATAGALMSGPQAPSPADVANALFNAQRVKKLMPDEPWGPAAECDVAAKLGDTEMLNRCVTALQRIAPDHYETKRYAALLEQSRPGWKTALGFVLFAALLVVTALRALLQRTRGATAAAMVALAGASLGAPCLAQAGEAPAAEDEAKGNDAVAAAANKRAGALSKYPIDPANPEANVPTPEQRDSDPLEFGYYLMDLGDMAEAAKAAGDHGKAAKVYRAMAKAVPDVPVAFVKACEEYEKLKDLEQAAQFCAAALTLKGVTLGDYSHYARVVMAKPGVLSAEHVANLDKVVSHLTDDPKSRSVGVDIQCTLGIRLGSRERLEKCAPAFSLLAPDSSKAIFFEWALALQRKDFPAAEKLMAKARSSAGFPDATDKDRLAMMEKATYEAMPPWRKGFRDWRVGAAVTGVLFAGLALLLVRRARRDDVTAPPQPASPSA